VLPIAGRQMVSRDDEAASQPIERPFGQALPVACAECDRRVGEIVGGIVEAGAVAVADEHIGPRLFFQHVGEILAGHHRLSVGIDIVRAGSNTLSGSLREPPRVNIRAAVSPITRPIERITPVIIPGKALGNTTLTIVCHLVAPRARLPSRYEAGTVFRASSEVLTKVGRIMVAPVRAPDIRDHP